MAVHSGSNFLLKQLFLTLLVHVPLSASQTTSSTATPIDTNWFGLGVRECFNQTCKFGQYCSVARSLGGRCRDCDDMLPWCQTQEKRRTFKGDKPSCYYICERYDKELLAQQLSELKMELSNLTKTGTSTNVAFKWDWLHSVLATAFALTVISVVTCLFLLLRRRHPGPSALDLERGSCLSLYNGSQHDEGSRENEITCPLTLYPPPADNNDNNSISSGGNSDSGNDTVSSSTEDVTSYTPLMSNAATGSRCDLGQPHPPQQVSDASGNDFSIGHTG